MTQVKPNTSNRKNNSSYKVSVLNDDDDSLNKLSQLKYTGNKVPCIKPDFERRERSVRIKLA